MGRVRTIVIEGFAVCAGLLMIYAIVFSLTRGGATDAAQKVVPQSTSTTTTTSSTSSSTTSTTSTSTATTSTTTVPRFLELRILDTGKCRQTLIGKMNPVLANLSGQWAVGNWGSTPDEVSGSVAYWVCDGRGMVPFDRVMKRGGLTINPYEAIDGEYRLMAGCGRNRAADDLSDCRNLSAYMDTRYLNLTGLN